MQSLVNNESVMAFIVIIQQLGILSEAKVNRYDLVCRRN